MTEVATTTDELQLVVFRLADEEFAVEVGQVQEIVEMLAITRLPRAPHFIKGIIKRPLRDIVDNLFKLFQDSVAYFLSW